MESPFSSEQLAAYRKALETKQQQVLQELNVTEGDQAPVDLNLPIGRLTRSDALQQQHMAVHIRQRLELQKTQIRTAFERMEKGVYGICVLCKKPISEARLEIMPESPLCIECQKKTKVSQFSRSYKASSRPMAAPSTAGVFAVLVRSTMPNAASG